MTGEQPLQGLCALIVEDEYFIADDLKKLLKQQGADSVRLSGTIGDALEQIRRSAFGFAILDINMRGEMAFSLADELLFRKVPFAFVSGYERSSIPMRFDAVPNWGKPYNGREVVGGIQALWTRPVKA